MSPRRSARAPQRRQLERFTGAAVTAMALVTGPGLWSGTAAAQTGLGAHLPPAAAARDRDDTTLAQTTTQLEALGRMVTADPHDAGRLEGDVESVAARRQAVLERLVASDPTTAAQDMLPDGTLAALGATGAPGLEKHVSLSGTFTVFHRDAPGGQDAFQPQLVTSSGTVDLYTEGRMAPMTPGHTVTVSGYQVGSSTLFIHAGCSTCTTSYQAGNTGLSTPLGPVNALVLLGDFSNSSTPLSASAEQALFSGTPGGDVDSWYNAVSWGKSSLTASVAGPFNLSEAAGTTGSCPSDLSAAQDDLMSQAGASVTYANYQRILLVFDCTGYGASTQIGESQITTPQGPVTGAISFFDATDASQAYYFAHELAHNLGNYHAAFYACEPTSFVPPTRFGQNCASAEYGDEFDVLGATLNSPRAMPFLDPYHANNAGWFSSGNWTTLSSPGTYTETLQPYETPTSGLLAIDIPRGDGTDFTLDYRQPQSFDSFMAPSNASYCQNQCTITQGPMLEMVDFQSGFGGGSDTQAIDTTPDSIQSPYYYDIPDERDGALAPGATFTDPGSGISITTDSASTSGATVTITVPSAAACTRSAPSLSLLSPATQSAPAGQGIAYTVAVTDNSSSGCPAMEYKYLPDVPAVGSSASRQDSFAEVGSPDVFTMAPGTTQDVTVTLTPDSTVADGSYSFASSFSGGIGKLAANSLAVPMVTFPNVTLQVTSPADATAPSAPGGLALQALGSSTLSATWAPSTDNVGVAGYRVVVDNGYLFYTSSTSFEDHVLSAGTSHSLSVQAYDLQGNLSPVVAATVALPAQTDTTPPTLPGAVTATASDRSVTVSWVPSTDASGVIGYLVTPFNTFVSAPATSVTIGNLPTDTTYTARVIAYDAADNPSSMFASYAPSVTVTTAHAGTVAPTQPTGLWSPQATTTGGILLSWNASSDPAGVSGYQVFRNGRPWATTTTTSYTDPPADLYSLGTGYQYAVEAVDATGNVSPPSPVLQTSAPNQTSADSVAPSNSSLTSPADASTVSGSVTLSTAPTDNVGIQRVEFYLDGTYLGTVYAPATGPTTYSWDSTTTWNGTHVLYGRAYDNAGNYSTTAVTTVTVANGGTVSHTSSTAPPAAPTNLVATVAGPTEVDLSWTASTTAGVSGYDVFRNGVQVATTSGSSWADTTVSPSTSYSYYVEATVSGASPSGPSNTVNVVTPAPPDTTPPSAPTNLTATAASSVQVNLSWSPSTDNVAVAGYEVLRGGVQVATTGPSSTSYADTAVAPGTSYSYAVEAFDNAGNVSAASNSVSVTTPGVAGSIAGKVVSSAGAALSGAKVTASSGNTNLSTTSSSTGGFSLAGLPAGTWTVTVALKGYKTASVSVVVSSGSCTTATVTLVKGH